MHEPRRSGSAFGTVAGLPPSASPDTQYPSLSSLASLPHGFATSPRLTLHAKHLFLIVLPYGLPSPYAQYIMATPSLHFIRLPALPVQVPHACVLRTVRHADQGCEAARAAVQRVQAGLPRAMRPHALIRVPCARRRPGPQGIVVPLRALPQHGLLFLRNPVSLRILAFLRPRF